MKLSEEEIGVVEGDAVAIKPITIEPKVINFGGIVPGESKDQTFTVKNNSQKEYNIRYNLLMDPTGEPVDDMIATYKAYVNGVEYRRASWLLLAPRSHHEVLIRLTLLSSCPIGNGVKVRCGVWTGKELIE